MTWARSWSVVAAVLVCAVGAMSAGCGGSSAGPSAPTPLPAGPLTITGAVTDAIEGSAVPAVTVAFDQTGSATSDADGQFVLTLDAGGSGTRHATLSGPTVVTRETTVTLGPRPFSFTLIPSTFDIAAFDEFARSFGSGGAIVRWTSPPALIVDTSIVTSAGDGVMATAEQITSSEAERVIAEMSEALPAMSGSSFSSFTAAVTRATPAGSPVMMYTQGAITVVHYTEQDGACGHGGPAAVIPQVVAGAIWIRVDCTDPLFGPLVTAHELGHALGYGHVTRQPSIMRAALNPAGITSFDRAAASIVAQRPPGSRSPDIDPVSFRITSDARGIRGRLVIPPPLP